MKIIGDRNKQHIIQNIKDPHVPLHLGEFILESQQPEYQYGSKQIQQFHKMPYRSLYSSPVKRISGPKLENLHSRATINYSQNNREDIAVYYQAIQQILNEENINLKSQAKYLTQEIKKSHRREKKYHGEYQKYIKQCGQLKQLNQMLEDGNEDMRNYLKKIFYQMSAALQRQSYQNLVENVSRTVKEIQMMLDFNEDEELYQEDKQKYQEDKQKYQEEEEIQYVSPERKKVLEMNKFKNSNDRFIKIKDQEQNVQKIIKEEAKHEKQINEEAKHEEQIKEEAKHEEQIKERIQSLNHKLQALIYQYQNQAKPELRKRCIEIAKEIKLIKNSSNQDKSINLQPVIKQKVPKVKIDQMKKNKEKKFLEYLSDEKLLDKMQSDPNIGKLNGEQTQRLRKRLYLEVNEDKKKTQKISNDYTMEIRKITERPRRETIGYAESMSQRRRMKEVINFE